MALFKRGGLNEPSAGSTAGTAKISSGTGVPTIAGTAGDLYIRKDTPTTANQRLYFCTVTGVAGAATWIALTI